MTTINRYNESIIYGIYHKDILIYIGSTIQKLWQRWSDHKKTLNIEKKNKLKLYNYMKQYPIQDFLIKIIENYNCNSQIELLKKEGEYQKEFNPECNTSRAGRTQKEYYNENKQVCQERNKEYYENNKEKCREIQKEWRINNADFKKELDTKWREENRELIRIKDKERRLNNNPEINCECGSKYKKLYKSCHIKTKKHIQFIENKNNIS